MKRISFAFLLACCSLTLFAQDEFKVNYKGAKPTISDFIEAFVAEQSASLEEEGENDESFNAFRQAWYLHRDGKPQDPGETFTVDQKNGYILYEIKRDKDLLKWEMCYWNEADGKHKLIAYNVWCFSDGKPSLGQFDGLSFLRYDNATKTMRFCDTPGFEVQYMDASYDLPRTGKDIIFNQWDKNGKKTQKTLKWNGHRFSF